MNVSQKLDHINESNFDDEITVNDIPKGHFAAVIGNNLSDGSTTRELLVEILPLEQANGGTMIINSGLFVRKSNETAVKVTVSHGGSEKATNTVVYS